VRAWGAWKRRRAGVCGDGPWWAVAVVEYLRTCPLPVRQ